MEGRGAQGVPLVEGAAAGDLEGQVRVGAQVQPASDGKCCIAVLVVLAIFGFLAVAQLGDGSVGARDDEPGIPSSLPPTLGQTLSPTLAPTLTPTDSPVIE